ncbi:hypothetical protein C5167_021107 [Papaver somniferum]|uniref:O-acyltransferase WSD1 C-terminal domain-containing protein n=1 Tax=Papaver somniferum TaxID=3469 RepID=A0A4Y7IY88_PAPSO|nr:hypothetical protein C5167_021107 [Papaver somniferum]
MSSSIDEEDEYLEPSTPTGEYYSSSSLSVSILAVLKFEIPIDDSQTKSLLKNVTGKNGEKHWKKVSVNLDNHIQVPLFAEGLSVECYDEYFQEYLSQIAIERLPQSRPLWEIYLFKYPTSNAAGTLVFKLHHALEHYYRFHLESLEGNNLEDQASPIRSSKEGVEFRPVSISTVTFSLDQIKEIKAKLGGTINDVMVGIIFYGIRLYMETANKDSCNTRSTALVVLNTREITTYQSVQDMVKPETKGPWGKNFAFFHVSIPDASSPLEFVSEAKKMNTRKKDSLVVYLTGKLLQLMRKLRGPEETSKYVRNILWKSSLGISNLIGPVDKFSLANHPVKISVTYQQSKYPTPSLTPRLELQ